MPTPGVEELVVLGIVDDADLALVVLDVGNRHAVIAHPAQEIMGAVDRVDDPDVIELALEHRRGLLAEERIAGKRRGEATPDQLLDRAIGAADEILRALVLDDQGLPLREEIVGKLAGAPGDIQRGDIAG